MSEITLLAVQRDNFLNDRDFNTSSAFVSDNIDAGHIIRRSTINLSENDTPYICFLKSVSLGTELIIETIENLFKEKKIKIFKQSEKNQKTYYQKNYTKNVIRAINRDFSNDLYKNTLIKMRKF